MRNLQVMRNLYVEGLHTEPLGYIAVHPFDRGPEF